MTVALGGASTLKPRKMIASQETRIISLGCEMELRYQQRPKLGEIRSEGRGLVLELALRVIVSRETLDGTIDCIACLRVGSQVRRDARCSGPHLPHRFFDRLVKAGTSPSGFGSVIRQYPVEERGLCGHLDHFTSFRVVGALC